MLPVLWNKSNNHMHNSATSVTKIIIRIHATIEIFNKSKIFNFL